tara:strand:+ start:1634 stop:2575 length:942 start_codon:yes stop_codon:yes gene_type:complete
MEDEEIIDPRKKKLEERKAAIAAKNAALIAKRKAAAKSREDALSEREIAAKERARLLKEKLEARIAEREAFAQKREAEIKAKRDDYMAIRKAKIDRDNETKTLAKDFDAEEAKRRAAKIAKKAEDDNYDWNYIDGDENTANKRQRTEIIEGEKEVERIIKGSKEINTFKPTGKTDEDVYNADPSLKKKYPTLSSFRIAAQKFRDDQVKTVETEEKVIEKVPTREEKVITQTREDWIKTQHWAEGLPKGLISKLATSMRKRGGDMTPKELYEIFKSQTSEKESAKWARANGYGYLLGGRGSRGSTTTRGKTNFN